MDAHTRAIEASLTRDDIEVLPDEGKFAELLLLAAEDLADDPFGGATKLNKILYYAEFAHVRETGRPITGVRYRKLEHGPAPRRLKVVRERLIQDGAAVMVAERFLGYEQHRLRPLRPARREMFSPTELKAVADAVKLLRGQNNAEASERSHREPGWRMVDDGADIPFVAAYLPQEQPSLSRQMRGRMQQLADDYARQGRLAQ